ncbi:MAG: VOC family protein [Planctomycetota bacterium]|nr:MAG: VOC family protein [Planctomycetota bacterium]REJ94661.1 MAG: VOC family protein [Planctomycetota bacterium]REK31379.1 MAG: VOC family protein [Planctomycetota bacterium]REK39102.1 MAG: VOC family protein [Planctomycetota bacterium]
MVTSPNSPLSFAHLRIARPTDRLEALLEFYSKTLTFSVLGRFQDHDGFDGIMLGHKRAGYHLEFTTRRGHVAGRAPSQEHLLVFYLPDASEWRETVEQIESTGLTPVPSFNPYWDRHGKTYEDPDGYRIVIYNGQWPSD